MSGDTNITVVGNLVADPDLRFTPSGAAVVTFTVASTARRMNPENNQWEDGDALFIRCNAWRQLAENAAESLTKGVRVIVAGRLKQRQYETREGEKRSVMELEVDEIGPSLRYATAKVARNPSREGQRAAPRPAAARAGGSGTDPWQGPPPSYVGDEPPF